MVEIPPQSDALIDAIDALLIADNKAHPPRDYLGASSIGDPCARKLWYGLNHPEIGNNFDGETLRRFLDGHRTEELITSWLHRIPGIELHTHHAGGKQYGFDNGKFRGHYDGVIRGVPCAPKTWHILEIKSVNLDKFNKLQKLKYNDEKTALKKWNELYYAQAVIYMYKENIERHLLIAATPGGRDLMTIRTNNDTEMARMMEDKANKIIGASEAPPRISDKPDFHLCRWCKFSDMCHGK